MNCVNGFAQEKEKHQFEHFDLDDGLSFPKVLCIAQDSRGFLWIGTSDGLNRYDGYSFTVYRHDPQNPYSLSSNIVSAIYEDKDGEIWIGTHRGGLNKFDRESERFTHFLPDTSDPNSINDNIIYQICEDQEGRLWMGTEHGGINVFDKTTQFFTHYVHDPNNSNSLSNNIVRSIHIDNDGVVWAGTYGGGLNKIVLIKEDSSQITHYKSELTDPSNKARNRIWSLTEDSDGLLWIGTYGDGLLKFDKQNESFEHYPFIESSQESLSSKYVRSILEVDSSTLWIGTSNGLNKFNKNTGTFKHYKNQPFEPRSLADNAVITLFQDLEGVIWVGHVAGVDKLNLVGDKFDYYRPSPNNSEGLNSINISSIYVDSQRNLWVGDLSGTIYRLDKTTGKFTSYPSPSNKRAVRSIIEDREGNLIIGTLLGDLQLFDINEYEFHDYKHDLTAFEDEGMSANIVLCMLEDSKGDLWLGTYGNGILRIRDHISNKPKITHYKDALCNSSIFSICEAKDGTMWFGTIEGLHKLNNDESITCFQHDEDISGSLSHNSVLSIHEDDNEDLWVGTNGGLNLFDRKNEIFKSYGINDGMSNDAICGILEDNDGVLWISTHKGISSFNPTTSLIKNFDVDNGLHDNVFSQGVYSRSLDGVMYFGGTEGISFFHPENVNDNTFIPPVVLTDFQIFNKSVALTDLENIEKEFRLEKKINEMKELNLSYQDYVFSFEFAALSYSSPMKNLYAYKLEGFDKDWNYTNSKNRRATYTNISPGSYIFRVKGSNAEGYWSDESKNITVIVSPPLYFTWWAKTAYVLILILLMVLFVRRQRYEVKRKEMELKHEKLITRELLKANKKLDHFTYRAAHDLKGPIARLLGICHLGGLEVSDKMAVKYFSIAETQAQEMNALLTRLLRTDVTKGHEVVLKPINLKELIDSLLAKFSKLNTHDSVNFNVNIEAGLIPLSDVKLLSTMLENLIDNSIQFMDDNKLKHIIEINIYTKKGNKWVVDVTDNGMGVVDEMSEKIFDMFVKGTDRSEGVGLGLYECRICAEKLKGEISLRKKEGWTTFSMNLPNN